MVNIKYSYGVSLRMWQTYYTTMMHQRNDVWPVFTCIQRKMYSKKKEEFRGRTSIGIAKKGKEEGEKEEEEYKPTHNIQGRS